MLRHSKCIPSLSFLQSTPAKVLSKSQKLPSQGNHMPGIWQKGDPSLLPRIFKRQHGQRYSPVALSTVSLQQCWSGQTPHTSTQATVQVLRLWLGDDRFLGNGICNGYLDDHEDYKSSQEQQQLKIPFPDALN